MTPFRPQHLSVSAVQLYVRCPAQYKARYVDKIVTPTTQAQAWGTAFHKALEALHRGEDAELAWLAAWNAAAAIFEAQGQSFEPGKMHGLALLDLYRERGLDAVCGEPERKFVLPFPSSAIPVPLLGFIDLAVPSEREFRDYKTSGGSYWNATTAALSPQVQAYGFAYQKLYRHRAERALWCVFSTKMASLEVYEVTPSADGFRLFELEAEATWRGIVEGRYEPCGVCWDCKAPSPVKLANNAPRIRFGSRG